MSHLIKDFECAMYVPIKKLLKARRSELIMDRGNRADEDQPFFFTGHWASGTSVKHGEPRFIFSIADTKVIRIAAGLTGGGPRSEDYTTFPNERFLQLTWYEKQAIIDICIGNDWKSLQAALKPSASSFGVVLQDLGGLLNESHNVAAFLNRLFELARPENITGEVRHGQPQYLLWCFIAYLRRKGVLLLPLRSYYVQFWTSSYSRYDGEVVFSETQNNALGRLWNATEKYDEPGRVRYMRIAQTMFLCADIQVLGDISPDAFVTVTDALMEGTGASPSYRSKFFQLSRSTYDFFTAFWNEGELGRQAIAHAGTAFRFNSPRTKAVSSSIRRRVDPFWFADVPNDRWHQGHPLAGYTPKEAVRSWAKILRDTFRHIKVKDLSRFRIAGVHWLTYINSLEEPPTRIEDVVRSRHVNDLVSHTEGTFRCRLVGAFASPHIRNDVLAALSHMFGIHLRVYGIDIRNPIEYEPDKFMVQQPRGKTPRTPLSPEMLLFLKEFNRRGDFAFSRSLKPLSWTTEKVLYLRHYRRIIDPEDGELKFMWWPCLAVVIAHRAGSR